MMKVKIISLKNVLGVYLTLSCCMTSHLQHVSAFTPVTTGYFTHRTYIDVAGGGACSTTSIRSSLDGSDKEKYSRELRLREEAESPFRKVRQFITIALMGGAMTSLAVSSARILAAMNGVNTDLMEESVVNAGVDIVGAAGLAFVYKRDVEAQESRLKRASKGAEFAKLMIRGTFGDLNGKSIVTSLSTLRRGRGLEKRAVIVAAGKDRITTVLQEAATLSKSLSLNDLVIVPVVMPQCNAPLGLDTDLIEQDNIALPAGGNWVSVIMDEASEAKEQNIDVEKDGFCVVLKKNGRVGQRTKGINLARMCGEVEERQALGMDVKNI